MFHKSQKTRGPDGLRPQGHRKSRADLKNNNFAPKNKWVTIWGGGPEHFLDRHGTLEHSHQRNPTTEPYNSRDDANLLNLDLVQYMLTDRPFYRTQG